MDILNTFVCSFNVCFVQMCTERNVVLAIYLIRQKKTDKKYGNHGYKVNSVQREQNGEIIKQTICIEIR